MIIEAVSEAEISSLILAFEPELAALFRIYKTLVQ